jgi:hypothetical protein
MQQQQQQQQQQDFVGRHVTFCVHPSDSQYTGIIQQYVVVNGVQHILLNTSATYHLFALSDVYGIQFTDNRLEEAVAVQEDCECDDDATQCESEHDTPDDFPDIPFIPARQQEQGQEQGQEQEEQPRCSICLDVIDMQRDAVSTECGHQFHLSCLVRNMASPSQTRQNCPLCREVMLPEYKVCSDDETVQRMMQIILQNNQSIQREIDLSERLHATLLQRMQAIDALRNRMVQRHEVVLRDALLMLDQNALASNLYTRIASVVASAANNDIRENYYDVHEALEDAIRTICFDFTLLSLGAQPAPSLQMDQLPQPQQYREYNDREHNYEVNDGDDSDNDAGADADADDGNRVNDMERNIPIVID